MYLQVVKKVIVKKWNQQTTFKYCTRLFAFDFAPILLGKA